MRTSLLVSMATPLLLAAGCKAKKVEETTQLPPPALSQVLPSLPFPPDAQPTGSQSGADATQIVLLSPHPVDSVAAYYRKVLGDSPFRLVNETKTGEVISFLADQNGPSLWVTIQPNGQAGSQVVIAGAQTDSTQKAIADSVKKANAKKGGGA